MNKGLKKELKKCKFTKLLYIFKKHMNRFDNSSAADLGRDDRQRNYGGDPYIPSKYISGTSQHGLGKGTNKGFADLRFAAQVFC
jgi:hypothetical protein